MNAGMPSGIFVCYTLPLSHKTLDLDTFPPTVALFVDTFTPTQFHLPLYYISDILRYQNIASKRWGYDTQIFFSKTDPG